MRGFTLIEMLVSIAIFTVVMVMSLGALLALSTADRRAEALKDALNNLNFALDSMGRDIRTGYNWGCSPGASSGAAAGTNCQNPGGNEFIYTSAYFGTVYYKFDTSATDCNQTGAVGCIARSTDGSTWAAITAPEVVITGVSGCALNTPCLFYLVGAPSGAADKAQPKLTITLYGYVQVSNTQTTPVKFQTTVTQRLYDQ